MSEVKPQFLLLSPWDHEPIEFSDFIFITNQDDRNFSGFACIWQPDELLLNSNKPKVWYYSEPISSLLYKEPLWQKCLSSLKEFELLYHAHHNESFRIPHITHVGSKSIIKNASKQRTSKAISIVTNRGHRWPFKRSSQIQLRNAFSISSLTDLYGKRTAWEAYRHRTLSFPKLPKNYRKSIEGRWSDEHKVTFMSQYKAAICLENTLEPHYFTEKFVDAVLAGCIPIYNPHPTVKKTILKGAEWVDPNDFNSVEECITHTLKQAPESFQKANEKWLSSTPVQQTEKYRIYERLGNLLLKQINA